jgi:3-oxoacyl-[acyl-carrier protein] reductase
LRKGGINVGRVAIVTGGASGIGRATAELLTAQGVEVAIFDLAQAEPEGVRETHQLDITDADAVIAATAHVRASLGPIDILVNAAGMPAGGRVDAPNFLATWDRTLDVNLTGALHLVRACLDDLLASPAGRIVNVASTEALGAARNTTPYTVSKHALLGFTRSLAVEYGRKGVTANCVCPGATITGMTQGIPEPDRDAFAKRRIPAGRYGRAAEVAYMIAALTAEAASFVNGAVIPVDGGMTAQA